ncbi:MAG TPA: mycofactocin system FadH/OYE family oxidoreductase 1 [Acidimicrobiales bacterium]
MTSGLFDPISIGARAAANRVVFGPHVTNLGAGRSLSEGHVAYYERRARGGCATLVTEVASVHESDWPYERAPLASACARGWRAITEACKPHGSLVLAGLGHAGMQGSTAWTQDVLWAPSLVANVMTHEQPLVMGDEEVAALVAGFAASATIACDQGCDGVELNAGQHSLLRQFCSGLTNLRGDRLGEDRAALLRDVVDAVRAVVGDAIVGVRFCLDELAPWAGITTQVAAELLTGATEGVDYVCFVRGSIYSEAATQPDGHVEQAFNEAATAELANALRLTGPSPLVCAQGSIVDLETAERLVATAAIDLVEMTRAQIADPDLCAKAVSGEGARVRPCILCNQHCLVRDPRNPIVSCCVNPLAGHEREDAALDIDVVEHPRGHAPAAVVVGGGVAGLEAARALARLGHAVVLHEQDDALGGAVRSAARLPGRSRLGALADWLEREAVHEGVTIRTTSRVDAADLVDDAIVVVATGGAPARLWLRDGDDGSVQVLDARSVADGAALAGVVVVLDPIGGPVGVGVAEMAAQLGATTTLITSDVVVGSQLSASGDLVDANGRLARAGVAVIGHARAVAISAGSVVVEDSFTALRVSVPAVVCVDAGHRVPEDRTWPPSATVIGDAVAPRGILMAMLEARRVACSAGAPSR